MVYCLADAISDGSSESNHKTTVTLLEGRKAVDTSNKEQLNIEQLISYKCK
jgi:hypothetical protein